jgi:hypothetical protein
MEAFRLERQMMAKIQEIEGVIEGMRREVSQQLFRKEMEIGIELTQDLREKCQNCLAGFGGGKVYSCKVCLKVFDDGRKLGGHVSRAHKE